MVRFVLAFLSLLCMAGSRGFAEESKLSGEWQGSIAAKLRLVLLIDTSEPEIHGVLKSLDQGNLTIPIDAIRNEGTGVRVELNAIHAVFEGTLTADGSEIRGNWNQGPTTLPLVFRRPGAEAKTTLLPVTRGRIALKPCQSPDRNIEGLCGTYDVFEDRVKREGRKLSLRLMLLPATMEKPAPDPVFLIAGGPGQSSIEAYTAVASTSILQRNRDVIMLDQRGTGESNQLACDVRNEKDAQAIIARWFPLEPLRLCRAELEKRADLRQYTTSIAADDLNEVREALGYGKVNLMGGSYGTTAALVYLRRHPETVRSAVLKAVAPPSYKLPLPFGVNIQSSLNHLFEDCEAHEACHKAYPKLREEFEALLDRMERGAGGVRNRQSDQQGKTGDHAERGMFIANLRPLLYLPSVFRQMPYLLNEATHNRWDMLGRAMYQVNASVEKGIARGMSMSVVCAENVPFISDDDVKESAEETWLGDFLIQEYRSACELWPRAAVEEEFLDPVESDVPVLMIAGDYDPATPPSAMREAAKGLTNATMVVVEKGTHGSASPCIDTMMVEFVARRSLTGVNTKCAEPAADFIVP